MINLGVVLALSLLCAIRQQLELICLRVEHPPKGTILMSSLLMWQEWQALLLYWVVLCVNLTQTGVFREEAPRLRKYLLEIQL